MSMLAGFDMRTLITVLIVGHVISLALLIVDFQSSRRQRGDLFFIFGRLGQLIGLVLVGQRGELSYLLTFVVGNSLVMIGQALESMAWVSLKAKMTKAWWLFYGVSMTIILACLWISLVFRSPQVMFTLVLLLHSAFFLIPGLQLALPRAGSSPTQKVIGLIYIMGFLAALWRYLYIMGITRYRFYTTDLPHSGFFVILIFLLIGGSQGYILIKKEHINNELAESNRNLRQEKETVVFYEAQLRKHQREQAELKILQAQIKPHFLQNTLGAIAHFCRVDAEKAQQLLYDLATYLRGTFDMTAEAVPLEDEMKLVRAYLAIEAVRLGPRLDVRYELEDELSACVIPPFTLQPLVENAVRHGIAVRRRGGIIRISGQAQDGGFAFLVEDDGVGIPGDFLLHFSSENFETRRDGQGLGLFSVDRRLRRMFGSGLKIEPATGRGTRVAFFIPKPDNCRTERNGPNA